MGSMGSEYTDSYLAHASSTLYTNHKRHKSQIISQWGQSTQIHIQLQVSDSNDAPQPSLPTGPAKVPATPVPHINEKHILSLRFFDHQRTSRKKSFPTSAPSLPEPAASPPSTTSKLAALKQSILVEYAGMHRVTH
jgi:hypothetical protein